MKARHIKKLRERISQWNTYEIYSASGLFGNFSYATKECVIKGSYPEYALRRFLLRYKRITGHYHPKKESFYLRERSEEWATFKVVCGTKIYYFD